MNMTMSATRFWQEAYLAAIRAGNTSIAAKEFADKARADFNELMKGIQ